MVQDGDQIDIRVIPVTPRFPRKRPQFCADGRKGRERTRGRRKGKRRERRRGRRREGGAMKEGAKLELNGNV